MRHDVAQIGRGAGHFKSEAVADVAQGVGEAVLVFHFIISFLLVGFLTPLTLSIIADSSQKSRKTFAFCPVLVLCFSTKNTTKTKERDRINNDNISENYNKIQLYKRK